jgi:hypothetical protein
MYDIFSVECKYIKKVNEDSKERLTWVWTFCSSTYYFFYLNNIRSPMSNFKCEKL